MPPYNLMHIINISAFCMQGKALLNEVIGGGTAARDRRDVVFDVTGRRGVKRRIMLGETRIYYKAE